MAAFSTRRVELEKAEPAAFLTRRFSGRVPPTGARGQEERQAGDLGEGSSRFIQQEVQQLFLKAWSELPSDTI